MGCTRQYVYKLVNEGKLAASRISSRMAFIRKADIEQMLAGNPYHRVLPGSSQNKAGKRSSTPSSSLSSKKDNKHIPETGMRFSEPLDYISGEDVMATYKVKKSWLYASAKRNNIPMCKIAGKNYYSRNRSPDRVAHDRGGGNSLLHNQGIIAHPSIPSPYSHQTRIWQDLLFKETS